jgi:hypothetical protein
VCEEIYNEVFKSKPTYFLDWLENAPAKTNNKRGAGWGDETKPGELDNY